jgi:hypothetical protein
MQNVSPFCIMQIHDLQSELEIFWKFSGPTRISAHLTRLKGGGVEENAKSSFKKTEFLQP